MPVRYHQVPLFRPTEGLERWNLFTCGKHGKQQPQNVQEGDSDREAFAKAIFSYKR